jgi:hypothetical protein
MRTVEQIQDHCAYLQMEKLDDVPLILTAEEIQLLHDTFGPHIKCEPIHGGPVGMFMGRFIWLKHDWLGHMLWSEKYSRPAGTVGEALKPSGPVRVGDMIKDVLKGWKFDPLPKDDSAL